MKFPTLKVKSNYFVFFSICLTLFSFSKDIEAVNGLNVDLEEEQGDADYILWNDFSDESLGIYSDAKFKSDSDWGSVKFSGYNNRISIVKRGGNKRMRITYPKGAYGHAMGGGTALVRLGSHNELYFRQTVRFNGGFDFAKGGKIPGLTSGEEKWTGGNVPSKGEGFSARYMWRTNGRAVLYLYSVDQKVKWGDDIDLGFTFKRDVDYILTQRVKCNVGNSKNGIIEVWVSENGGPNRLVLNKTNFRAGLNGKGAIDALTVITMHGGNNATWAPLRTSYSEFDDFIVTKKRFVDLPKAF